MAVQDVGRQLPDQAHETHPRQQIRRRRLAVNGNAMNAKLEPGREFGQCLGGALAAGEAVGENADMVAGIGVSVGKIEDMTENPADWRAYRMQDAKRLVWLRGHGQDWRSPARVVSPGLSEVPSGTPTRVKPEPSVRAWVTWSRRLRGEKPAIATARGRARAVSRQGITARTPRMGHPGENPDSD